MKVATIRYEDRVYPETIMKFISSKVYLFFVFKGIVTRKHEVLEAF